MTKTSKPPKSVNQVINNNQAVFMERGPGLDYRYKSYIVAKDTKRKRVLVGGLGGMGIGQMVFEMDDTHAKRPGFSEAPEMDLPYTFREEVDRIESEIRSKTSFYKINS